MSTRTPHDSTTGTTGTTTGIADALAGLFEHGMPFRFTAYDGSAAGATESPIHVHLVRERGLS